MKRRRFLRYTVSSAAILASTGSLVYAQSHDGHQAMMGHRGMGPGMMMGGSMRLLDPTHVPSGQPLKPLPLLANTAQQAGYFRAEIYAESYTASLAHGTQTEFWAYNKQVPGALIELLEGDHVTIPVVNALTQETTIHWHGLPVPPAQDGLPHDAIAPGSTRVYEFDIPENTAGTYWYHPHPHGKTGEQVFRGLAGPLIVRSKDDPLNIYPEQHWFISDMRLAEDGSIPANTMLDWMNGREGHLVLINGQYQPVIKADAGQRIRIWNACSARYIMLHIPGVQIVQVGTDGGLLAQPMAPVDQMLLAPAERAEVFLIPKVGAVMGKSALFAMAYDRQKMGTVSPEKDIMLASIEWHHTDKPFVAPAILRTLTPLGPEKAQKKIVLSEVMDHSQGMGLAMLQTMFRINDKVFDMNRIDLTSRAGEIEVWEVSNTSHMDHPFHIHGTVFQIVARMAGNGEKILESQLAYKDTVNLRPNETVWLKMVQPHRGIRMYHCHVLAHEDLGMMGQLEVI